MKKYLVAVFLLISFTGMAAASSHVYLEGSPVGVEYTGSETLTIRCDSDGGTKDCPGHDSTPTEDGYAGEHIRVQICGVTAYSETSATTPVSFTLNIPEDAPCGTGKQDVIITDNVQSDRWNAGQIDVTAPRSEPNVADYLVIRAETGSDPWTLRKFELTDNVPGGHPGRTDSQGAWVFISEIDSPSGNEEATYKIGNPNAGPPDGYDSDPPSLGTSDDKGAIMGYSENFAEHIYCGGEAGTTQKDEMNGNNDVSDFCKVNTGSINDGYCSDDPCQIAYRDFFGTTKWNYHSNTNLDPRSPANNWGGYGPQGELAAGYTEPGSNNKRFHVCREGSGGKVIDLYPETSVHSELYKCDDGTTSFKAPDGSTNDENPKWDWDRVAQCDDGVDNDVDGNIDYPDDPGCNSRTDNSEGGGCTPVIHRESSGVIRAKWGGGFMGDGTGACAGDSYTQQRYSDSGVQGSDNSPEVFTCDSEDINDRFCWYDRRSYVHDESSASGSQVTAVKYYPTNEYIVETLDEGEHSLMLEDPHKKMMNRFVNESGWKAAKMAVDDGQWGTESEQLYGGGSPHDSNYWIGDTSQKEMISPDGNYEEYSYDDSWIASNAGNNNDNVGDPRFPGGFSGNCDTASGQKWAFVNNPEKGESEWKCAGLDDWTVTVFMPEIEQNADAQETVGPVFMPYTFQTDTKEWLKRKFNRIYLSYKEAYEISQGSVSSSQNIDRINVKCWAGKQKFYPGEGGGVFGSDWSGNEHVWEKTVDINRQDDGNPDNDAPVPVYDNLEIGGNSTYSCAFAFLTQGGDTIKKGNVVEMLDPTSPGNTKDLHLFHNFSEKYPGMKSGPYTTSEFQDQADEWASTSRP